MGLLSLIVFLPLLFAVIIALMPSDKTVRLSSLVFATLHFVISLGLLFKFDSSSAAIQLAEQIPWIPEIGVTYFVGIDGLSLWLVILSTFLTPLIILGSWESITKRVKFFHLNLFLLQTAMLGSFLALDAILFYVFFELSLVPMYFIVGIWGGARRIYATMKFFIFTMAGSVLMLLGIIYLIFQVDAQGGALSANVLDFYRLNIPFIANDFLNPQTLLFFAFAIAFAIKVPMFPVHTWLPDAHVEAPTAGSVVLAAVMLKMGTYGFLRFVIPMFPDAAAHWAWLFMLLGVVGIIYGALVAMVQPDMKKLVAYSSVSHMGYVIIGLFALNAYGVTGGVYQMLNHGISTGGLFLLVGMIYDRTHSREIVKYGGLAKILPIYTILFFIITFSSIAVPMTNGFVGEFLILLGTFQANPVYGIFAATGVVFGAVYMLWMCKKIFFGTEGELMNQTKGVLKDLSLREIVVMAPLVVMVFWMGLFPDHFLNWSKPSLDYLVNNRENYELTLKDANQNSQTKTALIVEKDEEEGETL